MWWESAGVSLSLIALAEVGDKSQLACMALAARHGRARPVLYGAVAAFGVHALLHAAKEPDPEAVEISGHGLFATAFVMIFLAELGDKTQISVVGLAGVYPPMAVWLGATVALALTSAAGALAGKTVLRRLPPTWPHRLAGTLFLALSGLAIWRLLKVL